MAVIDELVTLLGVKVSPDAARNIAGFKSKITSLGKGVGIAVAALTGARVAVQAFVQAAAGQAAELQKLSDSTGISTDRLQEWGYAATAVGANAKAVQSDLANLQKRFGMMGSSDKILESLADQFKGMNPLQAAMMGSQYGLSDDTIRLLRQGADGIAKLKKEAHDIGAIIPEKDIQRGVEFNRTIGKLTYGLKALGTMIALGALPALEKFTNGLQRFIVANREWLKEKTQAVISGLVMGFDRFADRLGKVWDKLKPLREAFSRLTEKMEGSEIIAHLVEGALIALAVAAGIALLPFIKTIAIVAALAIVAEDLFESITTGEGVFADLWRTLTDGKGAIQGILDPLISLGKTLWDYLQPALQAAWSVLKDVWAAVQDVASAVMGFVNDSIGPLIQGISDTLDWLQPWYDLLIQIMTIVAKFTLGMIVQQFKNLLGALGPVVEGIGKFLSLLAKGGKWLTNKLGISDMADQLRDIADSSDAYDAGKATASAGKQGKAPQPEPRMGTELSRIEPEPRMGTELSRIEPEPRVETERRRVEPEPRVETERRRVEPEPAIMETERRRVEPKPRVGTERRRVEPEPRMETERRRVEPEPAIMETERRRVEPEPRKATERRRVEPEPRMVTERRRVEPEPAIMDVYKVLKQAQAVPQPAQRMPAQGRTSNTTVNDNSQRTYNITSPDAARVPELIERRDSSSAINGFGQFAPVTQ